jgi:hypothetical protein
MSKKGKELIAKCLGEIKQKNGGCVNMAEVAEMLAEMVVVNENDLLHSVIVRLKAIPRFDLSNYIVSQFAIETDREDTPSGDYVDSDEVSRLINDIESNAL